MLPGESKNRHHFYQKDYGQENYIPIYVLENRKELLLNGYRESKIRLDFILIVDK